MKKYYVIRPTMKLLGLFAKGKHLSELGVDNNILLQKATAYFVENFEHIDLIRVKKLKNDFEYNNPIPSSIRLRIDENMDNKAIELLRTYYGTEKIQKPWQISIILSAYIAYLESKSLNITKQTPEEENQNAVKLALIETIINTKDILLLKNTLEYLKGGCSDAK